MRLVMRPLGDPAPEPRFVLSTEGQIGIRRRHGISRVGGKDFPAEQAFLRFARHDRVPVRFRALRVSAFRDIQAQTRLAAGLVWSVTLEAAVGEDRADIAIELERFGRRRRRAEQGQAAINRSQGRSQGMRKKPHVHIKFIIQSAGALGEPLNRSFNSVNSVNRASTQGREEHLQVLGRQLRRFFAALVQQGLHQAAFAVLQGEDFFLHRPDRDELVNEN